VQHQHRSTPDAHLKVCFLSHSSEIGGAELALVELIAALKGRGISSFVLMPAKGPLVSKLAPFATDIAIVPYRLWIGKDSVYRKVRRLGRNIFSFPSLVSQLRRWDCDVMVTNTCTIPAGAVAAALLRKPHVWFIHEFGREDHGLRYDFGINLSTRVIDRLSACIAVNSDAVRQYYAQYIRKAPLHIVHYSVEISVNAENRPRPLGQLPVKLALVGRIHEGKGQLEAVSALSLLKSEGLAAELVLAGGADAEYLSSVKALAHRLGVEDSIQILGHLDNPAQVMAASDIVLLCSRCEAFGRVTVEALKLGVPVIGSDSGATPEIIQNNFSGLLYMAGNPADLAAKIKYLILNPIEAEQMASNAREWAGQTFTSERYAAEFIQVIKEALSSSSGQAYGFHDLGS
jgi:glycosyltransferase involved in cell wall biosynthesis